MSGLLDWVDPAREWWKSRPEVVRGLLGAVKELATDPVARQAALSRVPVFDRSASGQQMIDNAMNAGPSGLLGKIVYHGSPHKFDKFDASKIGTGEGAQAYGHGVYLADAEGVGKDYAWNLSQRLPDRVKLDGKVISPNSMLARSLEDISIVGKEAALLKLDDSIKFNEKYSPDTANLYRSIKDMVSGIEPNRVEVNRGSLYKADLPDEWIPKMLDWDKPLAEQAPEVRAALQKLGELMPDSKLRKGSGAMGLAESRLGSKAAAAQALREAGIPGIRYLDGGSRSAGQGSYNYVVFPGLEDQVKILERNGVPLSGLLGR